MRRQGAASSFTSVTILFQPFQLRVYKWCVVLFYSHAMVR